MYLRRPVVAVNTGGPTETIVNNETGFLCSKSPDAFADVMLKVVEDSTILIRMAENARAHVRKYFSFEAFTDKLEKLIVEYSLPNK